MGFACPVSAATVKVTVRGGEQAMENVPVRVAVDVPVDARGVQTIKLKDQSGNEVVGQLTEPGLFAENKGEGVRELHFVLPKIDKGAAVTLKGELKEAEASGPRFLWDATPGKHADLRLGDKPVLRYMFEGVDESSKERREETYKVYHHVFDPAGERLVTKGPGGLFPHHRGVFYGFNKITHDGDKQADVWHCRGGESQTHEALLSQEEGPVLGRHRVEIAWRGRDGEPFAVEQREMTVYNTPGGTLIEFASRLESADGKVKLDGDPQHAGFQFRASQHVPDNTAKQTYYLRPDGKGEPGSFRNWPQNKDHVNLPWNALSFVIDGQRYTCVYLDHPQNPKEARFSERDYGRFGSYFEAEIEGDTTLDLNYRLWLQEGEMSVEDAAARSAKFVDPPQTEAAVAS
ncbi:MAG: PmoA family protein [Planctomycetes bacterium]|nr:PmoA family protein [Planctomycetota bacterium]